MYFHGHSGAEAETPKNIREKRLRLKKLHENTVFSAAFMVYMRGVWFYNGSEHGNRTINGELFPQNAANRVSGG